MSEWSQAASPNSPCVAVAAIAARFAHQQSQMFAQLQRVDFELQVMRQHQIQLAEQMHELQPLLQLFAPSSGLAPDSAMHLPAEGAHVQLPIKMVDAEADKPAADATPAAKP